MTDVDMIQSLTGCTLEQAEISLKEYGSVEAAVDALLIRPTVSGEKYIVAVPKKIHHDPEQEERCANGRAMMDKLTAVSSAAHSKIRSGQSLEGGAVQQVPQDLSEPKDSVPSVEQSGQDVHVESLPSS
jgi:formylmethanofuran dehydrogenase subunit E